MISPTEINAHKSSSKDTNSFVIYSSSITKNEYTKDLEENIKVYKKIIDELVSKNAIVKEEYKTVVLNLNKENLKLKEELKESAFSLNEARKNLSDTKSVVSNLQAQLKECLEKWELENLETKSEYEERLKQYEDQLEHIIEFIDIQRITTFFKEHKNQLNNPLYDPSNPIKLKKIENKIPDKERLAKDIEELKAERNSIIENLRQNRVRSNSDKNKLETQTFINEENENLEKQITILKREVRVLKETNKELKHKVMQLDNSNKNLAMLNIDLSMSLEQFKQYNKVASLPYSLSNTNKLPSTSKHKSISDYKSKNTKLVLRKKTVINGDIETSFIV